jgi:hypothetical protein
MLLLNIVLWFILIQMVFQGTKEAFIKDIMTLSAEFYRHNVTFDTRKKAYCLSSMNR